MYKVKYHLFFVHFLFLSLLFSPDWPFLATQFRDYVSEPITFQQSIVDQTISFDALKQFFEKGWSTVSAISTAEQIQNAKKIINYWQYKYLAVNSSHGNTTNSHSNNGIRKHRGYSVELVGDIAWDMHLLSLYYQSPLPHIMQQLFGVDEIAHPKYCRVMILYPSLDLTESPALFGDKWSIDGFTSNPPSHSPYNLLIGIALTDIPEIDQGNFCVHSGSHLLLLEEYKAKVRRSSWVYGCFILCYPLGGTRLDALLGESLFGL